MKTKSLSRDKLPAIYHSASLASASAQTNMQRLVFANLLFLLLGSLTAFISSTLSPSVSTQQATNYWLLATKIFIALGIITTFIDLVTNFNEKWYGARAIAESVKTLSWLYMMKAGSFGQGDADSKLIEKLKMVLQEKKYMSGYILKENIRGGQITGYMESIRTMNIVQRIEHYKRYRLLQQKDWYSSKSNSNKRRAVIFSIAIILFQLIILALLFGSAESFIGILTSLTAAFIAWAQMKQYSSLRESYAVTAHELGFIADGLKPTASEEEFSRFVVDAERAISREHTLWQARKSAV